MSISIRRSILPVVIFLALSWYLFFFRIDAMGLTDPDETFYAQTAKEMLSKGEWLTPHIFGQPQFEKPILFYWLIEISFKIFGVNEAAARLPSAVAGAIGIASVYFLGALLFNKRTGLIAAVMLATSVEYVMLSRACVTDMTLFTLMLLGALFFLYGNLRDKGYSYLLSAAFFALAVLTKGPIAVMLPGLAFILYFILTKDWKSFTKIPFLGMAPVFIAVAAPWYIAMYKVHGSAFIDAFFGFQNVTRFMQAEHKIGSQVYYNIPILLGGFFPWSVFLPFGLWYAWKKARHSAAQDERKGYIFTLIWFFSIFLFFTASSTKLPTYIFPCFLAAAFMAAAGANDFLDPKPSEEVRKNIRGAYYALIAIVLLGIAGAGIYLSGRYPSILKSLIVPCSMLLLGFAMSLAAFIKKRKAWALALIAYAMILFMYPMTKLVLPELDGFETSKIVAAKLNSLMSPGEKVGSESRYMEGIAFYTDRIPQNLDKHGDMVKFLASGQRVWGVLKEKNHIQLYSLDDLPVYEQDTYMIYKLGKRAIVTNKMPADGKYLVRRGRTK